MKTHSLTSIVCILFIYACSSGPTSSEKEIEKYISNIYLATATFEDIIGGTLGDLKDVDVKNVYVSQSTILDTMNINFSRNSIAAIIYENLSPEERGNYDYIGVDISQKNGEKNPFSFSVNTLEKMIATKKVAYQFAESIKNKSYQNLEPIIKIGTNPSQTVKTIDDYFSENTANSGNIVNYYYHGAGEGEHQSKTYYSHLGTFVYGNGKTQNFFVNVFEGASVIEGYNLSAF